MTEKELREALLALDSARLGAPDARQITSKVLERDRRRVRLLAWLTIALWATASAGILLVLYALLALHPAPGPLRGDRDPRDVRVSERERTERLHWMAVEKMTAVVALSVAVLALAALGTVFLVLASRGATIRQVNASLVEISEQLKQLKQAGPS
jgi:hypothetical protein